MKPINMIFQQAAASLLILMFLIAISGNAGADPATSVSTSAEMPSPVTGNASGVAEKHKRDWHANPQAYLPDGLSDYSEDFAAAGSDIARSDATEIENADGTVGYRTEIAGAR